jgi:hypothetical protein
MKTIIDKEDLKGLKYYLIFAGILMTFYIYSMATGLRYLSFGESSHSREKGSSGRSHYYYHK